MNEVNRNLVDALCNVIGGTYNDSYGSASPADGIVLKRELGITPPSEIIQAVRERLGLDPSVNHGLDMNLLGICKADYCAKSNGIQLSVDQFNCMIAPYRFIEGMSEAVLSPVATTTKPATFIFEDDGTLGGDSAGDTMLLTTLGDDGEALGKLHNEETELEANRSNLNAQLEAARKNATKKEVAMNKKSTAINADEGEVSESDIDELNSLQSSFKEAVAAVRNLQSQVQEKENQLAAIRSRQAVLGGLRAGENKLHGLGWFLRFKPYKTTRGLATLKLRMNSAVPYSVDILVDSQESGTVALLGLENMYRMTTSYSQSKDTAAFGYTAELAATYHQISTRLSSLEVKGQNATVWAYPIIPDVSVMNGISVLAAFGQLGKLVDLLAYLY
jgi:hypothetical protein